MRHAIRGATLQLKHIKRKTITWFITDGTKGVSAQKLTVAHVIWEYSKALNIHGCDGEFFFFFYPWPHIELMIDFMGGMDEE